MGKVLLVSLLWNVRRKFGCCGEEENFSLAKN
jgi:hypothetical protein